MSYRSIYDGDDLFTVIEKKKFQYKLGEDGTAKSFILEITWTDEYPEVLPNISLDAFYNKHIICVSKLKYLDDFCQKKPLSIHFRSRRYLHDYSYGH